VKRQDLKHVLRAAAGITGYDRFVVIDSPSILGTHPDPPAELLHSVEADLFTLRSPDDAQLIDGSIGELSPFHRTFGYYAHGVGIETAVLPSGWQERLVPLRSARTNGAAGRCLETHDLAVSKLVAGRPKDADYVTALLRHRLVDLPTIRNRLEHTSLTPEARAGCEARLARCANART